MAYSDQKAAIVTHAATAGAALTPTLTDVAAGAPLPSGRCVRVDWGGTTEPVRMGATRTLNSELIANVTRIFLFDPVSDIGTEVTALTDAEIKAYDAALRTAILGDSTLGGTCTDLEMGYAQVDYSVIGNARYRVVQWDVVTDYEEVTIAA